MWNQKVIDTLHISAYVTLYIYTMVKFVHIFYNMLIYFSSSWHMNIYFLLLEMIVQTLDEGATVEKKDHTTEKQLSSFRHGCLLMNEIGHFWVLCDVL